MLRSPCDFPGAAGASTNITTKGIDSIGIENLSLGQSAGAPVIDSNLDSALDQPEILRHTSDPIPSTVGLEENLTCILDAVLGRGANKDHGVVGSSSVYEVADHEGVRDGGHSPFSHSAGDDNVTNSDDAAPDPQSPPLSHVRSRRYKRRPREEEAEDGVSTEIIDDLFRRGCCKAACIRSHNKKDLRRLREKWLQQSPETQRVTMQYLLRFDDVSSRWIYLVGSSLVCTRAF